MIKRIMPEPRCLFRCFLFGLCALGALAAYSVWPRHEIYIGMFVFIWMGVGTLVHTVVAGVADEIYDALWGQGEDLEALRRRCDEWRV